MVDSMGGGQIDNCASLDLDFDSSVIRLTKKTDGAFAPLAIINPRSPRPYAGTGVG